MSRFLCDFEVFGRVQGVFFRKYTKQQADQLNVAGWCMNTRDGTVKGEIEGAENNVKAMMEWLRCTGSPSSRVDKADFTPLKLIEKPVYDSFAIRR